ncbi:MAG: GDP-mannose 4,6-dehydratase [Candidatus Omnitrophica bacterium]|nr:GDP-mannose 4,6-dehydratase [Candidatus Omnitrophota bacterium]
MKRVIITGGTGFIGANLARRLLKEGHDLHLLVRPDYNPWRIEEIKNDVRLHLVELADAATLNSVVEQIRPDWIFHLAVYGAYPLQSDAQQMVQTNIIGTINLVEACLRTGFEVFINTGTSSEYGFKDHAPPETEFLEPNNNYAVTKASATMFCRYVAQSQRVHLQTLRLYSVYGPYEEAARLIPTIIRYGLKGALPPLVNPCAAHDYIYVDDVLEAYLLVAMKPSQEQGAVYNVGTGIQTSLSELVGAVRRVMGVSVEPKWGSMPDRNLDTSVWIADNRKIQEALGWRARYSFEEGFRLTEQWFRRMLF